MSSGSRGNDGGGFLVDWIPFCCWCRWPLAVATVCGGYFLWVWTQNKFDILSGLILTVLLDSYDEAYTLAPERKVDISIQEYNKLRQKNRQRYHMKYIGKTDLDTFLNIWNALVENTDMTEEGIEKWANPRMLAGRKLANVRKFVFKIMKNFDIDHENVNFKVDVEKTMLTAKMIIPIVWFDKIAILDRKKFNELGKINYQMLSSDLLLFLDNMISVNKLNNSPIPDVIIPLKIMERNLKGENKQVNYFVQVAVDVPKEVIVNISKDEDLKSYLVTPAGKKSLDRQLDFLITDMNNSEIVSIRRDVEEEEYGLIELKRKKYPLFMQPVNSLEIEHRPKLVYKPDLIDNIQIKINEAKNKALNIINNKKDIIENTNPKKEITFKI